MTATLTRPKPACADDPEAWFSDDEAVQEECKAACAGCPLLTACREYLRAHPEPWGVWAGLSAAERNEPEAWLRPMIFVPMHGRNSTYVSGCRCDICRRAHARYVSEWRARKRRRGIDTSRGPILLAVLLRPSGRGRRAAGAGQTYLDIRSAA